MNSVLERIERIENEGCFSSNVSGTGDDGEYFPVGERLKRPLEEGANDGGLFPHRAFGELPGGGKAGQFCAGAGAAGGPVKGLPGAEDEVLAVSVDAFGRRAKDFDVINECTVFTGDLLIFESLSNSPAEMSQGLDVPRVNFRPVTGDEKEPIAAPGDLSGDLPIVGDIDLNLIGKSIGRDVFHRDFSGVGKGGGDNSHGGFYAMIPRSDPFQVCQGLHDSDCSVKASVEVGDVVEKDDPGDAG